MESEVINPEVKETKENEVQPVQEDIVTSTEASETSTESNTMVAESGSPDAGFTEEVEVRNEKILNQIDYYIEHIDELRMNNDDIIIMMRTGTFDVDTAKSIVELYNSDIDMMKEYLNNGDETIYKTELELRDSIYKALDMRDGIRDMKKDIDELTSSLTPEKLAELYEIIFPGYKEHGCFIMLCRFGEYLDTRMKDEKSLKLLEKELKNKEKTNKILDRASQEIFGQMYTAKLEQFTLQKFIINVYFWNKSYFEKTYGALEENESWSVKYNDIIMIFIVLFLKFIYRKYLKDIENNAMYRNFFREFIAVNAASFKGSTNNIEKMNIEWENVLSKINVIVENINKN